MGYIYETDHLTSGGNLYTLTAKNNWDARRGCDRRHHQSSIVYGTGGVAFGDVDQTAFCAGCLLGGKFETWNTVRIGRTAGAGVDYAVSNNWSAGLEYRYTDLVSASFACVACNDTDRDSYNFSAIRFRVTYRFAPPPPPAAPMPPSAPMRGPSSSSSTSTGTI